MATSGDYDTRDEDRLPWLETVDDDYNDGSGIGRVVLFAVIGLALIAAAIFGYQYYQKTLGVDGNGELIAAPEGDYKVKPDEVGGLKVEGEGESAIATSDGSATNNATINVEAVPEAPMVGTKASGTSASGTGSGASKAVVAVPVSGGKLTAAPTRPGKLPAAGGASGGALVQLGSFASEGEANAAWTKSSKRFAYLAPLGKSVQQAEVNGRKVFRLRVIAGSAGQARDLCGKLKVAGEACFVAND